MRTSTLEISVDLTVCESNDDEKPPRASDLISLVVIVAIRITLSWSLSRDNQEKLTCKNRQ